MIDFAIPGDLHAATGGYVYARRVMQQWRAEGIGCRHVPLAASYPFPSHVDLAATRERLSECSWPMLIDGLAYGAFDSATARVLGPEAAVLLHHPLCDESGLSATEARRLFERERAALIHARHVIVTSPATARDLVARFDVAPERITVAEPGLDRSDAAPLVGDPPVVLAVGSLTPRKGYRDLIAALSGCADLPWLCRIAGEHDRDPQEAAAVEAAIAGAGLTERIALLGAVSGDEMQAIYAGADLFVSASRHEGYGMAVAEAMAYGLPILTTRAGALVATAPSARFVDPGDRAALERELRALLGDPAARRRLGADSHRIAHGRPGWPETAQRIAAVLDAAP